MKNILLADFEILRFLQGLPEHLLEFWRVLLIVLRDPIWQSLAIIFGFLHAFYHYLKIKQKHISRDLIPNTLFNKLLHSKKRQISPKTLLKRNNCSTHLKQQLNQTTQVAQFRRVYRFRHIKKMPKTTTYCYILVI
jgi:hypothetical protein